MQPIVSEDDPVNAVGNESVLFEALVPDLWSGEEAREAESNDSPAPQSTR